MAETTCATPIAFAFAVGRGLQPFGKRESQPFWLNFCGFPGPL